MPRLARDGYAPIGTALALAASALTLAAVASGRFRLVAGAFGAATAVVAAFLAYFFRDPERIPPDAPGVVVAPADGRVLEVEAAAWEPRFLGRPAARVSIFMSPLDVHVNRAPVDGEVTGVRYHPGRYFAAFSEKASLDNEQNAVEMRTTDGRRVVFVQIAGFLARRIVCRVKPGDRCRRGGRVGMIKLGSRLDIFVDGEVRWRVARGDRVRAGETVLGELL